MLDMTDLLSGFDESLWEGVNRETLRLELIGMGLTGVLLDRVMSKLGNRQVPYLLSAPSAELHRDGLDKRAVGFIDRALALIALRGMGVSGLVRIAAGSNEEEEQGYFT